MSFIALPPHIRRERWAFLVLFGLLWAYVIVRCLTVFHIHDELVTKWAYMIPWNFLPYEGYVDANNHFLLSFLGGLFIRIFDSTNPLVLRLPLALAFPAYALALYKLGTYFRHFASRWAFWILLGCCPFLLEFFSLARGYGLSLALLALGLWGAVSYWHSFRVRDLWGALTAWTLAVTANLTLLPLAWAFLVLGLFHLLKRKRYGQAAYLLPQVALLIYLLQYALHLRSLDKLYYGGQEGLISTTLDSLTPLVWGVESELVNYGWAVLLLASLVLSYLYIYRKNEGHDPRLIWPLFLLLSLANILGPYYLLGINFPEDRTALYLVVAFGGAWVASLDHSRQASFASLVPALIMVLSALGSINTSHSRIFAHEHLASGLLDAIPEQVRGIPPVTAGRFWEIAHARDRTDSSRTMAFQNAAGSEDSLYDYIIQLPQGWPASHRRYQAIQRDPISDLTLYERQPPLPRHYEKELHRSWNSSEEYQPLWSREASPPKMIRIAGKLDSLHRYSSVILAISVQDNLSGEALYWEGLKLIQKQQVNARGELHLDMTVAVPAADSGATAKVFIWNQKRQPLRGDFLLEVYGLAPSG